MTVGNREALATTPARETALSCVEAGIEAADPERVVRERVAVDGDRLVVAGSGHTAVGSVAMASDSPAAVTYDLAAHDEVVVLGGGKPAGRVAAALEAVLGDRVDGGVVVAPEPDPGAAEQEPVVAKGESVPPEVPTDGVTVRTGEHPLPGEGSLAGAEAVRAHARAAGEGTLVLGVAGGGGSALLAAPAGDLDLADLRTTTEALLAAGADIHEVNVVRKHLSAVKGGRLARAAHPATVAVLVCSDVVGDDAGVVASGLFAPDGSTFGEALSVLDRYDVDVPEAVRGRLQRGIGGDHPETPGPDDPCFEGVDHHVVASGYTAVVSARKAAEERGYETVVLSSRVRGEAREAALSHVAVGEECRATGTPAEPPAVVLAGGETTVTVAGDGVGGPNLEFALAGAVEFAGSGEFEGRDVALASVDTDGRDGGTDAAGALVDGRTVGGWSIEGGTDAGESVDGAPVDGADVARAALADNDAYSFLDDRNALVRTGPTGTNVNDLRVLVVE